MVKGTVVIILLPLSIIQQMFLDQQLATWQAYAGCWENKDELVATLSSQSSSSLLIVLSASEES